MKKTIILLSAVFIYFISTATSCEETESFVNIKTIETQIFNEINQYRVENGVSPNDPFVHQFIMVKEAQLFSAKMAFTTQGLDTTGISVHWDIIHDKIGGSNDLALIQATSETGADAIVENWTSDTTFNDLLLGDFSQCGVGVEYGSDQLTYVTVLLMLVEN